MAARKNADGSRTVAKTLGMPFLAVARSVEADDLEAWERWPDRRSFIAAFRAGRKEG